MSKKGVFFTLTAILFILVLLFFIKIKYKPGISEKMDMINRRVGTMDDFITSVESDAERALYISGVRSLLSMTNRIILTNEYIDSVSLRFEEAFFNGTINGEPDILITGSTFTDWADRVGIHASTLNIITSFSEPSLSISQSEPWSVDITLNLTVSYADSSGMASWNKPTSVSARINITGLEDPAYLMNTFNRVSNAIVPTPYSGDYTSQVSPTEWDVSNLRDHVKESYYDTHGDSPSYLMRIEGNLSQGSSCCGIESLVNLEKLAAQGIDVYDYSVVDHEYWANQSGSQVTDMQTWFRLDSDHRAKYGVDDPYF